MEKKQKTLSLILVMMLSAGSASAGSPASQFGDSGWPNRQPAPCITQQPFTDTACTPPPAGLQPVITQQPVPTIAPVITQVPQPTAQPTEAPAITEAPPVATQPAATPVHTPKPTVMPEGVQTPKPTPAVTQTPAPQTTATAAPEKTQKPVMTTPAPSTDDDYTTGYVGMQEEIAFLLLNQDRAANGMQPLKLDPALCGIARAKSQDMRDLGYFAHNSPTYGSVSQMLKFFGYSFSAAGENIAHHATVEKSQAAFMSSAGHRRNILSSSWTKVGIGVVTDPQGYVYVTQIFAR